MNETRLLRVGARRRRKELLLTLVAAAEAIGCSKASLSRWERQEAPVPQPYWRAIEGVLRLSPRETWIGVREGVGK